MANTIFWSWQSDRPARETRGLIRDALLTAIGRVAAEMEEADRPEIDHDTRGVAGSPDIVATILAKIESASIFVADVTPIALSDGGKHLANPNVLIELGYAKRALGTERVLLVWNTAFTGAQPEDLPFDMRHRRAPFAFNLAEGAPLSELRKARADLTNWLEQALRASLATLPQTLPVPVVWQKEDEFTPSIWEGGAENSLVINLGFEGTIRLGMDHLPRGYARLLPTDWKPVSDPIAVMQGVTRHPIPLGRYTGLNWGTTRGGFIAYRASGPIDERRSTPSATRWFRDTGELWGVASSFFSQHGEQTYFSSGYAAQQWLRWITHNVRVCEAVGGRGPYHLILGLDGMDGAYWPGDRSSHSPDVEALESGIKHSCVLPDDSEEAAKAAVKVAYDLARRAYGLADSTDKGFENVLTKYM